jgi:RecA-family ATPase
VNAEPRIRLADFEGLPAASLSERHYQPLDLFGPVPPVDWVVENVVVGGEATLLVAEGGAGKSFFSLALSLAVAGGEFFLDNPVKQGRVTYVDEEGSPSLALQRLVQLGASDEQKRNLDYLNYAGVDLVRNPDALISDVVKAGSVLVVLDSFSKVARASEENSNDAMSRVWDEGILRLARLTGVAVLVVHHTNTFGGTRGATQIRNSADQVLTMKKQVDRSQVIWPSKPRRKTHRLHFNFHKDAYGRLYLAPVYDYEEWK